MIPGWQLEAYERLRTVVVASAVRDLEKALRKSDRLGAVCDEQRQMERWFRSKWGQLLSGDNGELIIEKCHKRYKTTESKTGKQHIPNDVQKRIYEEYINGVRYTAIVQRYGITPQTVYEIVRRWSK